jgi:EAL domain-containing protein (putative c-di-GMP-specific phosphodiesterase class I)
LRRGLERNEFSLYYQPQFSADGKQVLGFEALLRWNSQEYGFVTPDRFIPVAEQSGLILPIGRWVLQEACQFARRLVDIGRKDLRVAINISARQLMSDKLVADVQTSIEAAGINPGQIEIEITESVFIESMEDTIRKLCQLRNLGVELALDDFGTGYSSLTYLRSLPVGILKIDKLFIDKIISDQTQLQVVETIIDLGHHMDLEIVAEGVESAEQLQILEKAGCNRIQGYIFSKPLTEPAAMSLLEE